MSRSIQKLTMVRVVTSLRGVGIWLRAECTPSNFRRYFWGLALGVAVMLFVGAFASRYHPTVENLGRLSAPSERIMISEGQFLTPRDRKIMLAMEHDVRLSRALAYLGKGGFYGGVRVDLDACRFSLDIQNDTHFDPNYQYINFCFAQMGVFQQTLAEHNEDTERVEEEAALFILLHELGHAFIMNRNVPVLGSVEDAADQFATMLAIHVRAPELVVAGALFFEFGLPPKVTPDDQHAPPAQRAYRVRCLAYGSNPQLYPKWVDEKKAAATCVTDYKTRDAGWLVMLHDAKVRVVITGQHI